MISDNHFLYMLDISYCQLNPKNLMKIAEQLSIYPHHIKNLNISFNHLKGGKDFIIVQEDDVHVDYFGDQQILLNETEEFFKYMTKYIHRTNILMHANFNGLEFM